MMTQPVSWPTKPVLGVNEKHESLVAVNVPFCGNSQKTRSLDGPPSCAPDRQTLGRGTFSVVVMRRVSSVGAGGVTMSVTVM